MVRATHAGTRGSAVEEAGRDVEADGVVAARVAEGVAEIGPRARAEGDGRETVRPLPPNQSIGLLEAGLRLLHRRDAVPPGRLGSAGRTKRLRQLRGHGRRLVAPEQEGEVALPAMQFGLDLLDRRACAVDASLGLERVGSGSSPAAMACLDEATDAADPLKLGLGGIEKLGSAQHLEQRVRRVPDDSIDRKPYPRLRGAHAGALGRELARELAEVPDSLADVEIGTRPEVAAQRTVIARCHAAGDLWV